jgi:transcriptional regulator with XRE-family HTH domain
LAQQTHKYLLKLGKILKTDTFCDRLIAMKELMDVPVFGKRVLELRKMRGWSQPDLGKMIGTSGTIIGRYERGEITPSVEVAHKLARVFGVTVDSLISEEDLPAILKDQTMVERLRTLDSIPPEDKDRILFVMDSLVRDAKARQTYSRP